MFGIVFASFWVKNKLEKACFLQAIFLVAETSIELIFGMSFFLFNNANIRFAKKELTWRTYSASKALPTTKQIELIDCKKFVAVALDLSKKAFIIHMAYFRAKILIYLA